MVEFNTLPDTVRQRLDRTTGCWIWLGARTVGYGYLKIEGKMWRVHRYVYTQLVGPIPEGLSLDHLCRNPPCANPQHLEPVTHLENVRRGQAPSVVIGRTGYCKRNLHPLSWINGGTRRVCIECRRRMNRRATRRRYWLAKGVDS